MKSSTQAEKYHDLIKPGGITFRECDFFLCLFPREKLILLLVMFEINKTEEVKSVFAKVFLATVGARRTLKRFAMFLG